MADAPVHNLASLRKPVALIGMMGVGKTRLGKELAKSLGHGFIDSDSEIEHAAGCSIQEIFDRYGEPVFRDGEKRVIQRLIDESTGPRVIATGGGAVTTPETLERLKNDTYCIWLMARVDTLVRRTAGNTRRPLLKSGDPAQILSGLLERRETLYGDAAHIRIQVDDQPLKKTLTLILDGLATCAARDMERTA